MNDSVRTAGWPRAEDPAYAPSTAGALEAAAAALGSTPDAARLVAQLKTAAVLSGTPNLSEGEDSWRDLLARVARPHDQARAELAWAGLAEQEYYVSRERVAAYLLVALERMASDPDEPHHRCTLLSPEQTEAMVGAAAGPDRPLPDRRFHELFEERVRLHPDTPAAVQGTRTWTYAELNRAANRIARYLHTEGLQPEDVVAVVAERTLEWLAAVIGVFKAGGCYLPLEPRFPAGRMGAAIDRSACRWALAGNGQPHLAETLAGRPGVRAAELAELIAAPGPDGDLGLPVAADQLAYIYFTSGSTGEPKGAMCEHGGFLNHLYAKIEDLGIAEGYTVAQTAPQCFDISLWQLVAALLVGGHTFIVEQEVLLDLQRCADTLAASGVQIAQLVPTYLDVFLAALAETGLAGPDPLPDLRCMAVTGEALKMELVHRWFARFPHVPLVDCYGTTESSDDTNHSVMRAVPELRAVPIGPPIRGIREYVVDERLQLVPDGAPGEIVFAGICVGRGYVNDEERTKAAYTGDPYRPQDRLYHSGDFGRRLPTGQLEYLGRRDSQVKISGFRIEIGEIENRLARIPGVRDCAVVIARSAGEPQLVGYYTGPGAPEPEQAAAALAESLPHYMVPRRLYRLGRFPLSDNGKIDRRLLTRRALAEVEQSAAAGAAVRAPGTETERRVARIWSALLKVPAERIGPDSHFAELGGTSLAAIRLAVELDRAVSVEELWRTSTLAEVAALLESKGAGQPAGREAGTR